MTGNAASPLERARAAKPHAKKLFESLLGEVAIGITRIGDNYGLKVNLTQRPADSTELPTVVNGVPVLFEVTGRIVKRAAE